MPPFFQKVAGKSNLFIALFGHPNSWGKSPLESFDSTKALLEDFGVIENEEIAERLHQEEMKETYNKMRRKVERDRFEKRLKEEEIKLREEMGLGSHDRSLELPATQKN